ncbi:MAG TPA: Glu/Leu/Phe/Val dehydrogenase [Vicinamibacterales bacterium]|nr:Glu/Leu/Phe/Val dehydrogenase [Vicinamibacterales bacterium]
MHVMKHMGDGGHEQVVFLRDAGAGLTAIVAIHSTMLGPALGGTRMYPYATEEDALRDVLELSRGMTYKAAAAGLPFGGAKAVIVGDPSKDKNDRLFGAFGRFVNRMNGLFHTGEDVGTDASDMDVVRKETRFVGGASPEHGGAGDPSPVTAYGVVHGMKACAAERWGQDSLEGRLVAVQGLGKVGWALAELLLQANATVIGTDVDQNRRKQARKRLCIRTVPPDEIYDVPVDIFAPCAMGGAISEHTLPRLTCEVIAGSANNQIAGADVPRAILERGILYAPDYVINAGGLINVHVELHGYHRTQALTLTREIDSRLREIFAVARRCGIPTSVAADRIVEQRLTDAREALRYTGWSQSTRA